MSNANDNALTGVQRAAVLLLSLGEEDAAEVLKHMNAKEVQKLGIAMAPISGVSREQVMQVISTFGEALDKQTSLGMGADDYVRKVLVQALGEDKAGSLIDRILLGRNTTGLDTLKWMDPRAIADLVRNEHPQIIAIVLAHLDSDQAAETLKLLAERTRTDVLLRIATLDGIPPNALNELNEIMERQFAGAQNLKSSNIGGVKVAANILNYLETGQDQSILGAISQVDQELSNRIQDLMFVFDDLVDLDRQFRRGDAVDIVHESGRPFARGLVGYDAADALDTLIYLDAQEADLEHWFVARFMTFWHAAATDPASFYAQFRGLDEPGAEAFARSVWTRINLPNLRDHIRAARDRADIILTKDRDHRMQLTFVRNG